jgi:hypothetical protein
MSANNERHQRSTDNRDAANDETSTLTSTSTSQVAFHTHNNQVAVERMFDVKATDFIAGTAAGITGTIVGQPLDLVKVVTDHHYVTRLLLLLMSISIDLMVMTMVRLI